MTTYRILYLDVLRIIATFAVIFLHVSAMELYSEVMNYDWFISVVYDCMVRWAVPVFVMISGALFLNPNKEVSPSNVLKKYIPRLLMTYLFWWIVYSLFRATYDTIIQGTFIFRLGYFVPHSHLWFLPMLACVYLLIPFLRKIAADDRLLRYALILWGCYMALSFSLLPDFPQLSRLFFMNIVLGYAGYFLLGRWLFELVLTKKQSNAIYLFGFVGFVMTACSTLIFNKMSGGGRLEFLNNLTPWVCAMAMSVFVFVKQKTEYKVKSITRVVNYVRNDLFGIYLTHGIWLMIMSVPAVRELTNLAIMIPLLTVIIFVLSLYTTKLIRKISFLQKVIN
jgi:surface polysaccharide O-acyltransferase-like enzyme